MTLTQCDWERFWHPREVRPCAGGDGFLYDPKSEFGRTANAHVVPFEAIRKVPCLALLGEPGMGKSFAVTEIVQHSTADCEVRLLDLLRDCGTDNQLFRNLFDAAWFRQWKEGVDRQLELFLDSLDECRTRFPTIAAVLAREFQALPHDRLTLRIACRTAEWPEKFGVHLSEQWGKERFAIYEMAPLRRQDVVSAAASHGVDAERFVAQVVEREVQPFAARPITLELLFNIFKGEGQLPTRLAELYERGLPLLCEETPDRLEVALHTGLSGRQQVAVASRIAAALVLGDGLVVRSSVDRGNVEPGDVLLPDLTGYAESVDGTDVPVDEAALRETTLSGLFSFGGPERRTFAHQTYVEFLVARYLHRAGFSKEQIYNLITVPDEQDLTIAPQLEEIAAWLASMNADIFKDILGHQPEILVRGDIATLHAEVRRTLVDALLERVNSRAMADWFQLFPHLKKLDHPTLSNQLRGWLSDAHAPEVREAAVDIARSCSCSDLSEELATVALNQSQPMELRERAAAAVAAMGTPAARSLLKPLARGEGGDDPRDQLRGYGLRAVWPDHMAAEELFSCLYRRRDDHFLGSYWIFLRHSDFTSSLKAGDLLVALRWIIDQKITLDPTDELHEVAHAIVLRAWDYCDRPDVRQALAAVLWDRIRQHDSDIAFGDFDRTATLKAKLQRNPVARRGLLSEMVVTANPADRISDAIWCNPPLVYSEDFEWLLGRALASDPPETERWIELARYTFDPDNLIHVEATHSAMSRSLLVRDAFGSWFKPVDLGSREALEMKARHEQREKWQRAPEPTLLDPPPHQRVKQAIDQCLGGCPELWWHLARELTLEPTSKSYKHDLFLNPTGCPGWRIANSSTRAEISEAARRFVQQVMPDEAWIGTNSISVSELGGFAAFRLLLEEDPTFLESLDDAVWRRWAPSIFAYLVTDNHAESVTAHHRLIAAAYRRASAEILATLDRLITEENEHHGRIFVLQRLDDCWDSQVSQAVLRRAAKLDVKPACFGDLLKPLLNRRERDGLTLALSMIKSPPPTNQPDRDRSVEAAAQLLAHDADTGWATFWMAATSDPAWTRQVFERMCQGMSGGSLVTQLDEAQVGRLLDWLLLNYSHDSDPKRSGGFMGGDDMVRQWRDGLIYRLRDWGTAAAVAEIQRLKATHPELPWLEWTSLLASKMRQKHAWKSATPRQIVEMAQDRNRRLVATGGQLLDVLQESLGRLQEKLQGETPRARLLWDTVARRPKEEEDLSDYIKGHLEDDLVARGIVVGREVKIRRRNWSEGAPGQLTDIHVDAVSTDPRSGPADRVRVVVEVKGCWHQELKTAMQTQLLERYLAQSQCQHGLYVVGWCLCDAGTMKTIGRRGRRRHSGRSRNVERFWSCRPRADRRRLHRVEGRSARSLSTTGYPETYVGGVAPPRLRPLRPDAFGPPSPHIAVPLPSFRGLAEYEPIGAYSEA
jgi:hypothetical protein